MKEQTYNGWKITYDVNRPVTGTWRAEQYGVGLSSSKRESLERMIDRKNEELRKPPM